MDFSKFHFGRIEIDGVIYVFPVSTSWTKGRD